jgi:ABC-type transport system involved in multi-copper enzyme maturation permease subunit
MLPGPMFSLEMVTAARRSRYFIIRVLYAVILLLCLLSIYGDSSFDGDHEMQISVLARFSYNFFVTFSILQLLLVVGLGPAMAAGTIASERERRTIEHVFVTQLSNAEIVLGKLLARLYQTACLAMVGLPILSLAMLMGGITPEALLMLFLVTLSTLLTVSILSITVSVWSARSREAVTRAYLLVIVWLVIPPIAAGFLGMFNGLNYSEGFLSRICGELLMMNPFWVFSSLLRQASGTQVHIAWEMLWNLLRNQGILCTICIVASTLAVRRVHLKEHGKGEKKKRFRLQWLRPAVGDQPMLWKELFAEPAANKLGWLGYLLMGILVFAVVGITVYQYIQMLRYDLNMYSYRRTGFFEYTATMSTIIGCIALLLLAARAAGAITSEKERDCWISLLGTPLLPREIVWAKVAGNLYTARWLFFLQMALCTLALTVSADFILPIIFHAGTFLMLAFFVSTVGVHYSLYCKTSLKAMAATLATLIFVGGGYLFCCFVCFIGMRGGGPGDEAMLVLTPCIPFLLAFPYVLYLNDNILNHAPVVLVAYFLGTVGYGVASGVLFVSAVNNFDRLAGRTGRDFDRPRPIRS